MDRKSLKFDVLIVGGGPAGMSAALWCADLNLSCCILESAANLGGQLHQIYNPIGNYLGTAFENGEDCFARFRESLKGRSIEFRTNTRAATIEPNGMSLTTNSDEALFGKAIVIATGVRRRHLGVPGESEFRGKGLIDSGARDPEQVGGHRVAVIGGGDSALENALILAEHAEKVYLIHRREAFSARDEFVSAVEKSENIETVMRSNVERFGGDADLAYVEVRDPSRSITQLAVSKAIVRVGFRPNSEFLRGIVDMDVEGYIKADTLGQTSVDGIYAVGDVVCKVSPMIASAVGSAATAVKSAEQMIRRLE